MEETPDKVAALLDAVRALEGAGIAHALIGGVAVGIHAGVPRATLDTDLAVTSRRRGRTSLQQCRRAALSSSASSSIAQIFAIGAVSPCNSHSLLGSTR